MFILDGGCGWIPDPPIKFMYHIINLIKNLTPVILIIMGSLDFGKAVMSQKEDEIKKAQGAFIKKVIAGAAVFFTIVFAKWIVRIVDNAGGDTGNAWSCVSLLLNGSYSAEDKTYYDGPTGNNTTTTKEAYRTCYDKCMQYSNATAQNECLKSCQIPTTTNKRENCLTVKSSEINACIQQNTGNTAQQFYNYDSFYNSCIKSFQNQGDFYNACLALESCMQSKYSVNSLCEEMSYSEEYNGCKSQFESYNTYANKYGQYSDILDEFNEKCNAYANEQVKNSQNGIVSNDNIEAYCKNLYCND